VELVSKSVAQTVAIGELLGRSLQGGEILALVGELGTGKTHLIKGIAIGLQTAQAETVTSPTFTLINEYAGRLPLYHIDAYRLDGAKQLENLGFDEICSGAGVVVVEWADRVWELVEAYDPVRVFLEHKSQTERRIRLENLPGYIEEKLGNTDDTD